MAFAAFLATGCGAFLGTCLWYLLGGPITVVSAALFTPFQALSPGMRLFVTIGFRGDLTASSTFSAKTATPLRREHVRALGIVGNG